jgi:hypothetical protein
MRTPLLLTLLLTPALLTADSQPPYRTATVRITTPMAAPAWAMLERELLRYNSEAVERFDGVAIDGRTTALNGPVLAVRLEPGAGARLHFRMTRYALRPTFALPWDRGWYPGTESQP